MRRDRKSRLGRWDQDGLGDATVREFWLVYISRIWRWRDKPHFIAVYNDDTHTHIHFHTDVDAEPDAHVNTDSSAGV
jgi:hypothetical protein